MRVFWNAGQAEIIKGLDILGLRQVDQAIEKDWVSNVTTISFRARYLSLLPWVLAEFFAKELGVTSHAAVFDDAAYARLAATLARLEFVVVLSTIRGVDWGETGFVNGVIGSTVHKDRLASFAANGAVVLPEEARDDIYGTYVMPCQGFGLLTFDGAMPQITPRGKDLAAARQHALGEKSQLSRLILQGGEITRADLEREGRHFSVNGLPGSGEEHTLLVSAMLKPYVDAPSVTDVYGKLRDTIAWAKELAEVAPGTSEDLIRRAYQNAVTTSNLPDDVRAAWTEYELRRRVHFSLELLLSVLTSTLSLRDCVTISDVVEALAEETAPAVLLKTLIGLAALPWNDTVEEFRSRLPMEAFLGASISVRSARSLTAGNRCILALAVLVASASQSLPLRKASRIPNRDSYMERVFKIFESGKHRLLGDCVAEIFRQAVVEPHLKTTYRKMAEGQQCSLRVYPEGEQLRTTKLGVAAGHSGDRLGNVLGMLADLGIFERGKKGFAPSASANQTLATYGVH